MDNLWYEDNFHNCLALTKELLHLMTLHCVSHTQLFTKLRPGTSGVVENPSLFNYLVGVQMVTF